MGNVRDCSVQGKTMRVTGREDESPRSRSACLLAMVEITETFPYSHLLRHGYDVRELTNGCSVVISCETVRLGFRVGFIRKKSDTYVGYIDLYRSIGWLGNPLLYRSS